MGDQLFEVNDKGQLYEWLNRTFESRDKLVLILRGDLVDEVTEEADLQIRGIPEREGVWIKDARAFETADEALYFKDDPAVVGVVLACDHSPAVWLRCEGPLLDNEYETDSRGFTHAFLIAGDQ